MPDYPLLRKITKIVCWIYSISFVLFVLYQVIMMTRQFSSESILVRVVAILGLISTCVFIVDMLLLIVIGTIDLWNKPRSKFTIAVTVINYFVAVIVLFLSVI